MDDVENDVEVDAVEYDKEDSSDDEEGEHVQV